MAMNTEQQDPATWLEEHGDALFRCALARLGDRGLAEDMVQETLLAAFAARDRYDGRAGMRGWLMGILKHKVVDHIRRSRREVRIDQEDAAVMDSLLFKAAGIPTLRPSAWPESPHRMFERKEVMGALTDCLARLRDPLRTAFALRELDGLDTEDVCKILGVKANHLWVLIYRAREQLKSCLTAKQFTDWRLSRVDVPSSGVRPVDA